MELLRELKQRARRLKEETFALYLCRATAQDGQEIVVRLDNGTTIAVVQGGSQGSEAGQRVRVLSGPKGSRVEHA